MKKELHVWIYEYRDDNTPVGATLYKGLVSEMPNEFELPHLDSNWHYIINTSWKEVEEE